MTTDDRSAGPAEADAEADRANPGGAQPQADNAAEQDTVEATSPDGSPG